MPTKKEYKVTAIVSVYKAEEFLQACLEDLVQQTIFEQTEVIIIDACSPENEKAIALSFTQKYENIIYVRTSERETLYASWNRGISMASGQYITNANADDRHAPHAFERMAKELDEHPNVALVYAKYRITAEKNALFATAPIKRQLEWIEHDHLNLLRRTEVGPQPMWRKSVHEELGVFKPEFTVAGDYDMWMRISEHYPLRYIPEELGLCLEYDNNLEAANPQKSYDESWLVKKAAYHRFMLPNFSSQTPIDYQFRRISAKLTRLLDAVKRGKEISDLSYLELQFFSCSLLSARFGYRDNALELLDVFYALITDAKNIAYLYRFLLLTSEGELPGILRHESALNESPRISVIVPLSALDSYLEDTLLSVLAQTEKRWEMALIHDGCSEHTLHTAQELLGTYNDPRIQLFMTDSCAPYHAYTLGAQTGTAPFMCVLEPQHMLAPTYFATAMNMLEEHPHAAWVCPKTLAIGAKNALLWKEGEAPPNYPCPAWTVHRRSLWEALGGYLSDTQVSQSWSMTDRDTLWNFWLRAQEQGYTGLTTPLVEAVARCSFQRVE